MRRYMLRLSYIGTNYRGSQKHANSSIVDIDSIQGAIESFLYKLNVTNEPSLVLAGRTDAGVHALCTAAHIDLERPSHLPPFDTSNLVRMMNRYLINCGHEIRIFSCHEVSQNFHARYSAKTRQYIYRLMVPKDPLNNKIPISESNRTLHLHPHPKKFDIELMKKGVPLFIGTKDFMTFSAKPHLKKHKIYDEHKKRYIRTLNMTMEKAEPLMPSDPLSNNYNYWNLTFTSKAFLYNQIRRIVGSLIGLGMYRLSEEDIITMLQVPSHNNWHQHAVPAPPHGLYLLNVEYDESLTQQISS